MSARRALKQAAMRPLVEGMAALLLRHGLTPTSFRQRLVEAGHSNRTHKLNLQLAGGARPRDDTLEVWAEILGEPAGALKALRDQLPQAPRTWTRRAPTPPEREAPVVAAERVPSPSWPSERPPQFSMVVDHNGRASLTLNLIDVPIKIAMQAMSALNGVGLLNGDEAT